MTLVYQLKDVLVERRFGEGGFRLTVPSLEIESGEHIAVVGESGCGKSTLLDLLALVLQPSQATQFEFRPNGDGGSDVAEIWRRGRQNRLSALRGNHIGYVLQMGGLLPYLSVRENIELPRRLMGMPHDDTVASLARALGIHRQLGKLPGRLSAGERQRAAFARALAHKPKIVIADEPVASLDPVTARKIMMIVTELVKGLGVTMIIASHDWAHMYKLNMHTLHHSSQPSGSDDNVIESVFSD
jgi:putative ABC transport system ATP-binding protein